MENKEITIEDLAGMVQKGFQETAKKVDMDFRFEQMDKRFDKIEKLILESDVKQLKDLLAFK